MSLSEPALWVNQPSVGYVINAEFSEENKRILAHLIDGFRLKFRDKLFYMPERSLHITLLDWIAPLVGYDGQNKAVLYENIYPTYDKAMTKVLASLKPITVIFDEIKVSPNTIYITGHDNGQFKQIRKEFVDKVELLPNTKLPPQIIHSSLARFIKPVDLNEVEEFITSHKIDFTQAVTDFRLTHTTREPLLEFELIKRYQLS